MADLELPETLTVTLVRRVVGLARRVVVRLPRLPRRELLDDLDDLREVPLDCLVLRVVLLVTVTLPLLHLFAFLSQMRLDAFHWGVRPVHLGAHLLPFHFYEGLQVGVGTRTGALGSQCSHLVLRSVV